MRHLPTLIVGLLLCGAMALPNSFAQQTQEEIALSKLQSDFFALEERVSQLIGQQEELQHNLGLLQRQISGLLENLQNSNDDSNSNAANEALLQRLAQLEELALGKRLQLLESEDIGKRLKQLEDNIKSAKQAQPAEKSEPAKEDTEKAEVAEAETPPASAETSVDDDAIQAAYREAFAKLGKRQYEAAETAFKDFITNHSTHPLVANAVYWLGESYYVRGDYRSAAQQFLTSYNEYPKGSKRFDSLLKLVLSMKALKQNDQACLALKELLEASKTAGVVSDSIRNRAEKESETLKCP